MAHIAPEAAEGGPLAVVKDGDIIEIDIPNEELNILISPDELRERLEAWKSPQKKVEKGYLAIYSRLAKSAEKGATLNYKGG